MATVVHSHSSTKVVVITVVQEENTIDHGVLLHPTMIETRSGATVQVCAELISVLVFCSYL